MTPTAPTKTTARPKPPGAPTACTPLPAKKPTCPTSRASSPARGLTFGRMSDISCGQRIVIYGPGGIGKTTLAMLAPGPVAVFDLDHSLHVLASQLPELDIRTITQCKTWLDLRGILQADGWDEIKTIVIDSGTEAEELCLEHVLATIPTKKDGAATKMEDYGWGAGYRHVYDTFVPLLGDLDAHFRAGRNIIVVCHDTTEKHPNPQGEDWLRNEPRFMKSPKSNLRERVRDWCDHLLFIGYDVHSKDGKGKGSGTRTLWPCELPHCMAKSRSLANPVPLIQNSTDVWDQIFS